MVVDESNNVYIAGHTEGTYEGATSADYVTIKYDSDGNELWVGRYNGTGNWLDYPESLGVDGSGNVYVTGMSMAIDGQWDYATIKYDSDGKEMWVARYDGVPYTYTWTVTETVQASTHGKGSFKASQVFNWMALILGPLGALGLLQRLRKSS